MDLVFLQHKHLFATKSLASSLVSSPSASLTGCGVRWMLFLQINPSKREWSELSWKPHWCKICTWLGEKEKFICSYRRNNSGSGSLPTAMPKGPEALTPQSSHICLQAQTALNRLGSDFCANASEYRSTSGTANKECSIKHLQCCWAFLQISHCLFLLPSSWCKNYRAKRDVRWVSPIQPLWRLTCENGHQLMMRFQKQNKPTLPWVKFRPVDWQPQKVHDEDHGHRLCS